MKNFRLIIIALLVLLATKNISAASQNPLPGNLIVSIKQNTLAVAFSLQIANLQQLKTSITLVNETGEILHSKQIEKSNGIRIKYMLRDFPDGIYKLEINWNNQIKTWEVYKNKDLFAFRLEGKKRAEGVWLIQRQALTAQE